MKSMSIRYEKQSLDFFDEVYERNGYALLNEPYEDEERFYNNTWMWVQRTWMWGRVEGDMVYDVRILDDLSSKTFAKYDEAMQSFLKKLEIK